MGCELADHLPGVGIEQQLGRVCEHARGRVPASVEAEAIGLARQKILHPAVMDGTVPPRKFQAKLFLAFEKAELDRLGVGRA
jgi:hypothetical protein